MDNIVRSYIKCDNVSLSFTRLTNRQHTIKESLVKFIVNFGHDGYVTSEFEALHNISFELNSGDKLAIIGRNGAGKTTLLRTICGIYKPASGKIEVKGKISSLIAIGVGFNYELTGRENILLTGLIAGFSHQEIKAKEQSIIEFADIGEAIDVQAKYYSTGMAMRLNFSIATHINPDILIIDELFAGGDINFIEKSSKKLEQLKGDANIFICAPHDMSYVKKYCNKILYLEKGHQVYFGTDIDGCIEQYTR
jgi:ABC-type polysaccharide/polyol phosphate transport system ATPase subunit